MNYKMIDNKTEQESEKHDNLDLILKIKKLEKEIKKIKIKNIKHKISINTLENENEVSNIDLSKRKKTLKLLSILVKNPKLFFKFLKYTSKNSTRGVLQYMISITSSPHVKNLSSRENKNKIIILTGPHTLYVAKMICITLNKVSIESEIIFKKPENGFTENLHIVLTPQIFKGLPKDYIVFQMEQLLTSEWLDKRYWKILKNAYGILDYSLENIEVLQELGLAYNNLYYVPISKISSNTTNIRNEDIFEYDIVFYGTTNSERRSLYLDALKNEFKVLIVTDLFGDALHKELKKAKIVVNIHYYENAPLETTRIFESISLSKVIVSEDSHDISNYENLDQYVDFVPSGDIGAMVNRIKYWLENHEQFTKKTEIIINMLNDKNPTQFDFYFLRYLLSNDLITFDQMFENTSQYYLMRNNKIVLSLPESFKRREYFKSINNDRFDFFPGLRHNISWIGAGLSYKYLFTLAEKLNIDNLIICEDDTEFFPDHESRETEILNYLKHLDSNDWNIFCGVIADFNDNTEISNIVKFHNEEYIHINKMTSTVFNIYNKNFFKKMVNWDQNERDVDINTIDRYIENMTNLKIITTMPYLVGHNESLNSSLWNGQKNTIYSDLLDSSVSKLTSKISLFIKNDNTKNNKITLK